MVDTAGKAPRSPLRGALAAALALLLAGCASTAPAPQRQIAPLSRTASLEAEAPSRYFADQPAPPGGLLPVVASGRTANYLTLSGGGVNGAFGVGYLLGWSASGTRPQFDMVTGISAGALIAPMAFLGPRYDERLRVVFERLMAVRKDGPGLAGVLLGAPSVADNRPVAAAIAQLIDAQALDEIAAAHRAGRRLYIGTTNIDAERPVIWDIGAIAAGSSPDRLALVRRIILASAAVPGIYPAVSFDLAENGAHRTELHIDGSVTQQVVMLPGGFGKPAGTTRRLYVIYNDVVEPDPQSVGTSSLAIMQRAVPTLLKYRGLGDLRLLRDMAARGGLGMHLVTIPPDYPPCPSLLGDAGWLRDLLAFGFSAGSQGQWSE